MAEIDMNQAYPTGPEPRLKPLEVLVGTWEIKANHPEVPGPLHGWATYEWFPGGKFLLARTGMNNPDFPAGIMLIGYDEATGDYVQHYFDSRGLMRDYHLTIHNKTLTFWRNDPEFSQRFTYTISDDGNTINLYLEKARGNAPLEHDFDQIYERVK